MIPILKMCSFDEFLIIANQLIILVIYHTLYESLLSSRMHNSFSPIIFILARIVINYLISSGGGNRLKQMYISANVEFKLVMTFQTCLNLN